MTSDNNYVKQEDWMLYINSLLSSVTVENPLEHFNSMYKSINPHCIEFARDEARKLVKNEHKKNGKQCNVYMSIGGDSINESLIQGIIAGLLWLPNYIKDAAETFKLDRTSIDTTLNVLNSINLPKTFDAYDQKLDNGETVKIQPSNCRHYATFIASIVRWLTTGVTSFQNTGEPRVNIEMVRYLASTAMNSFPSIPYCSYFIGTCKTTDMSELAVRLAKEINWTNYMTKEAYQINQPRFVVQTADAALVGVSGHPLSNYYLGQLDPSTNKAEWFGVYVQNEQFQQLCTENGFSIDEVRKYSMGTSKNNHVRRVEKNDKLAMFIENNKLLKIGFDELHKYDLSNDIKPEDVEGYNV